ncbi:hypothetical protein [Acidocella sp.]|uniref:hypothetical protein n=1 Tax=Acidocella sp. TaxID=50710 RepID=UPI003D01B2FB
MIGDVADMVSRIRQMLPGRWFADQAPVLNAVLNGLGQGWAGIYTFLQQVRAQTRIATATGIFLDIAALDYFGNALPRRAGEGDSAFSARLKANLLAPRATRAGLVDALISLTGQVPTIFEPMNTADTGGYNVNVAYNNVGGYGCLSMPYQFLVTVKRPTDLPANNTGGYGVGPGGYDDAPMFYASAAELAGNISDSEIYATIAEVIPTASIAWTKITN